MTPPARRRPWAARPPVCAPVWLAAALLLLASCAAWPPASAAARPAGSVQMAAATLAAATTTQDPPDPPGPEAQDAAPALAVAPLAAPEGKLPGAVAAPQVAAEAWLLADLATGQVLASHNATQPRAMASTTKLMTALLVRERLDLDQTVTVGPDAAATGEAGLGLVAGERLTVRQLLAGLLVRSANDAAVALADAAAGSVEGFVRLMNDHAQTLGLADTHFVNPHGLDAPGHQASARDLARLWLTAMADPALAELAASPAATLPGPGGPRQITSTNELLGVYPWLEGGKTGHTDDAGYCLVASAVRGGRHLVAVALGSPDAFTDVAALLDHGFAGYVRARLAHAGGTVGRDGRDWFTTLDDVDALVRRDLLDATEIELDAGAGAADPAASLLAGGEPIGPVAVGDVRAPAGVTVPVAAAGPSRAARPAALDPFLQAP